MCYAYHLVIDVIACGHLIAPHISLEISLMLYGLNGLDCNAVTGQKRADSARVARHQSLYY